MKSLTFKSFFRFSFQTNLFINGSFHPGSSNTSIPVLNPASGDQLCSVSEASPADVSKAVESASKALYDWSNTSPLKRAACMYKLADLMEKEADALAQVESLNTGKPYLMARRNDLGAAVAMFRYYAGFADKIQGQSIPLSNDFLCYTKPEPVGVCALILPWNFPLAGLAAKIAPAAIAGCTVVLKPAELTPLSALYMGRLFNEAGFPHGSINIINGYGDKTGDSLMRHHLVNKVSFTGSTQVGLHIMQNCHSTGLKKVSLELGGKSAYIVLDDADLEFAARQAQGANFYNSGQICIAGSRVFVHDSIYEKFVQRTVELTREKVVGDPQNEKTELGPLISEKQRSRFLHYVSKGVQEGAKLLVGGNKIKDSKGFFVEPTVFSEVNDDMTIAKEEIFGPVMSILRFKTIDEVIQRANSTQYGLVGGVITPSIDKAMKVVDGVKCGTVWVNCYGVFESNVPFGGVKNSGIGKEHGEAGLREFLQFKTVVIKKN